MKKIIYIISILASVSVYANVYEKNVDGVETISNIYTPGAKQMDIKPAKVVNPNSINEDKDGTIYWNNDSGQPNKHNNDKKLHDVKKDLNEFINSYKQSEGS